VFANLLVIGGTTLPSAPLVNRLKTLVVLRIIAVFKVLVCFFRNSALEFFPPSILRIRNRDRGSFRQHFEICSDDCDRVLAAIPADRASATGAKRVRFPPDAGCVPMPASDGRQQLAFR
jgi:hypothetical protein